MRRSNICTGRIADWNEQIRAPVDLVHHWRAAYSECAAERRRPEDFPGVGIVSVDRAVAAKAEKQTAGSHDDTVSHLRDPGTVNPLCRKCRIVAKAGLPTNSALVQVVSGDDGVRRLHHGADHSVLSVNGVLHVIGPFGILRWSSTRSLLPRSRPTAAYDEFGRRA